MSNAADSSSLPPADEADVRAELLRRKADALTARERKELLASIDASLAKLDETTIEPVDRT